MCLTTHTRSFSTSKSFIIIAQIYKITKNPQQVHRDEITQLRVNQVIQ